MGHRHVGDGALGYLRCRHGASRRARSKAPVCWYIDAAAPLHINANVPVKGEGVRSKEGGQHQTRALRGPGGIKQEVRERGGKIREREMERKREMSGEREIERRESAEEREIGERV